MIKFKPKFILSACVVACLIFIGIIIWQLITLNQHYKTLNNLKNSSAEISREIEDAKNTLEIVSQSDYQALQARKKGLGIAGERRFVAE